MINSKTRVRNALSWLYSGAAAASFVAVTQLATRPDLHEKHLVALQCFAAAMPMLVVAIFFFRHDWPLTNFKTVVAGMLGIAGMASFVFGTAYLLWSFGNPVITCFIIGSAIAMACRALCQWGDSENKR